MILKYPHSALTSPCAAIPPSEALSLVATLRVMLGTTEHDRGGLGLSANQIGTLSRVFVLNSGLLGLKKEDTDYFINPSFEGMGQITKKKESCLSFPADAVITIARYEEVQVTSYLLDGTEVESYFEGLAAQCIQHEMDHLNGRTLVQTASSPKERKNVLRAVEKDFKRRTLRR